jgi:hypothetical protein
LKVEPLRPFGVVALVWSTALPCSGVSLAATCGDERDEIIQEYVDEGVDLKPECSDFTQTAHSAYFTHQELTVKEPHFWALVREPLTLDTGSGYGLDKWRDAYGSARKINSGYRSPKKNASIGGAKLSRHMHGDAADLNNDSGSDSEYAAMKTAAQSAQADYIEPETGPCKKVCVHADWRDTVGPYK